MSAPVVIRSNFSDFNGSTMLPALEDLFKSELELHPSKRDALFNMKKAQNGIYQYSEIHEMPLHSQVGEGTEYSYKSPNQGVDKTMAVVKYGLGASISDEMIRDNKFDMVAEIVKKMARSAKESQEIQAMSIFNGAFSTVTTADGQALCSTAHTLPSGLTFSNKLATDADLSQSSLGEVLSSFETAFILDNGAISRVVPKAILVHPSNKRYAKELTGSDLKPDTNNNNLNAFVEDQLVVLSSPHLTDTDAWFVLADKSETGLVIVEDYGIQTKGWEDMDRDSVKYKSRYREVIGATHAYGIIGTTGA